MGMSAGESFTTPSSWQGPWDDYRACTAWIRSASRWILQYNIPPTAVRVLLPAALACRKGRAGKFCGIKGHHALHEQP